MSDFTELQLVGRHVPDPGAGPFDNAQQAQAAGYDVTDPVTGTYEIGAMVDGAFVPIIVEKASLVFDRVDLAKQQAAQAQDSSQAQTDMQSGQPQGSEQAPATGPQTVGGDQPSQPQ